MSHNFFGCYVWAGVFACNHFKETSNAIEDEKHRVVDEEEALAYGVQATGAQLRASAMGSHARSGWMWDDQEPARGPQKGHQVSPVLGLGQTGMHNLYRSKLNFAHSITQMYNARSPGHTSMLKLGSTNKSKVCTFILSVANSLGFWSLFQVPLFQYMDDLVLENICDRVKSLIFPKGETVSSNAS